MVQYLKPAARSSGHTDASYAAYLQSVEVRNAALRAEQADVLARQQIAVQRATAVAIEKQTAAIGAQKTRPSKGGKRQPAAGTLDERALAKAKQWQKEGRDWQLDELCAALPTRGGKPTARANLIGKRAGKPRSPLFFAFWQDVQTLRANAGVERHEKLERGRK